MSHRQRTLTQFGLNVRRRREAIGLSQEALAEKAELDRTYISGVGVRTLPPALRIHLLLDTGNDPLIRISNLLGFVQIAAIFADE